MSDAEDIVERLRRVTSSYLHAGEQTILRNEAADTITTLRAEVERLTKAAEVSDQEWCDRENEAIQLEADFVTAEARADKAEAERDAAIARAEKAEKVLGYLKQDCLASGFSERSNSFVLAGDLLTSLTEGE